MKPHSMITITKMTSDVIRSSVRFGVCLAIVISWSVHHSLPLAIWHGIWGWLYVGLYALGIAMH